MAVSFCPKVNFYAVLSSGYSKYLVYSYTHYFILRPVVHVVQVPVLKLYLYVCLSALPSYRPFASPSKNVCERFNLKTIKVTNDLKFQTMILYHANLSNDLKSAKKKQTKTNKQTNKNKIKIITILRQMGNALSLLKWGVQKLVSGS